MGRHKPGKVSIGSYVDEELREYLDKLVDERGFSYRSDSIIECIREHMLTSSSRIDRNKALTPKDVEVKGNHYTMDWDIIR